MLMKSKLLSLAFFLLLTPVIYSQTFLWESFDAGQMPPAGWSLNGLPAQWSVGNSNAAGGVIPEGKFSYTSGTTTTRLISPMIDLTGMTTVKLTFRFFYDYYGNPAPKIGIATRSHNGAWTSVWEQTPTGNIGPIQKNIDIANSDVGQTEFQFCLYLNGNMFNLDYVYVDNFLLFSPLPKDAALVSLIGTPYYSYFADPLPVKGTIINSGNTAITDAEVVWQLDGGTTHLSTFTGLNIQPMGSYDFTCADLLNARIGLHDLKVWITNINGSPDDYRLNDTLYKQLNRVCATMAKKPLFEEFTSSTCSPCQQFNLDFVPWCISHENDITLVKYQMDWPGNGDPYYTPEGGVRKDYYGVGGVPDLYCNGGAVVTDIGEVETAFGQAVNEIGIINLTATHTFTGHVIDITATVLPYADFSDCRLYIVVMEKVTHNNVGGNGETSFHHVMMKMIPDAEGSALNLQDRVPVTITESIDLTGTFVEEWTDLIVGIFVQDYGRKTVYQSDYSIEDVVFNTESRLESIEQDGTLIQGFSPDVFTYDVTLPAGTVIVPTITATPMDTSAVVIIVPTDELPGTTTIDVFSEDLATHSLYSVNFTVDGIGIGDSPVKGIQVYPNPTRGIVHIMNAEQSKVNILSMDGRVVASYEEFSGSSVDLSSQPKGIYLLTIEKQDKTLIRKKIILL